MAVRVVRKGGRGCECLELEVEGEREGESGE